MRVCTVCKQTKSLEHFHKEPNSCEGHRRDCKNCRSITNKAARLAKMESSGKPAYQAYNRNKNLKKRYGITLNQYTEMYSAQAGACLVCLEIHAKLHVDHDHKTEKVRGLLCRRCNVFLTFFDNRERLLHILKYLRLDVQTLSCQNDLALPTPLASELPLQGVCEVDALPPKEDV